MDNTDTTNVNTNNANTNNAGAKSANTENAKNAAMENLKSADTKGMEGKDSKAAAAVNGGMSTAKMARMAMLVAISVVLVLIVHFPLFPSATFLEYDPADIPIFIGTFAFGPAAGVILTVLVSVIQGMTVSASGQIWGIIMHIMATGSFAVVAGNIYRCRKDRKGAVTALAVGAAVMAVVMCGANIVITPIYTGMPRAAVAAMILPVFLPFNLLKAGINAVITFLLYKRISPFLHRGLK